MARALADVMPYNTLYGFKTLCESNQVVLENDGRRNGSVVNGIRRVHDNPRLIIFGLFYDLYIFFLPEQQQWPPISNHKRIEQWDINPKLKVAFSIDIGT